MLDERLKNSEYSIAALVGTMLHQIFQVIIFASFPLFFCMLSVFTKLCSLIQFYVESRLDW